MTFHEIVNKVDNLISDTSVKIRFTDHIDCFCKMVENYVQALQPYVKQLKKAEVLWKESKSQVPLVEFCPTPKDWVEVMYLDNFFIDVDISVAHRPVEPANPLLWFGLFGNANLQRKPTENEQLMCEYVLLAIIHDYELQYSGTPIDRWIFSADYKWKWFERHKFCEDVWIYYHYDNQSPDLLHYPATAKEKLSQLNRSLEHVQADIDKQQKTQADGEAGGIKKQKHRETLEGKWSNPMTKSAMMSKVCIDGYKKFKTFANQFGLRQAGNRQLWQIRLDKMDENTKQKFEKT